MIIPDNVKKENIVLEAREKGLILTSCASMSERVLGINYEGGKAIRAACASPKCVAAFNCQIAMDAPFEEGKDAPEEVRQQGRTETRLGASDERIAEQLAPVLQNAVTYIEEKKGTLVVQIARGRSALPFWAEVVKPVLDRCLSDTQGKVNVTLKTGYRTIHSQNRLSNY